jgi:hypothetical protein
MKYQNYFLPALGLTRISAIVIMLCTEVIKSNILKSQFTFLADLAIGHMRYLSYRSVRRRPQLRKNATHRRLDGFEPNLDTMFP